ncbi:breast cancer type 2 susceptibility protein homolog isoform X1 [Solenopsis invicta]|uniref:breast cancer type 2 susceptibility protein homolog isoform X1 n=2 Tax=Solenopsis invicta TaxID=13686 RepID=UPI00193E01A3|nr:breast cancer type 2 susceptibility protein homolog isoform X1 [Solenopsis invicta]
MDNVGCRLTMDLPETDSAEDDSDELFSDDEQRKEIRYRSNVSLDTSISNRSETPLSIFNSPSAIMPTDATVPSTPLSLVPFLNKINEQWSSDLETPQADPRVKPMTSTTERTQETPKLEQRTPDVSTVKSADKIIPDSPVIVSRATRRRSKRRIFRTSTSIDPLAVTNNEDIIVNAQDALISDNANFIAQVDTTNVAISNPSRENVSNDCEPKVLNKCQNTCNNEEPENLINSVPDSLNSSTQEFFSNASFSKIDELCFDTFNNQKTMETTVPQYNHEKNIKDIDKQRDVKKNENISFFTARGSSINVSKQALLKAKRLFEDMDMDETETQSYEPLVKRNCNEKTNRELPSSSFANNISVNIAKEVKPKPLTEQLKNYDKMSSAHCKNPLVNKSPDKEVNKAPPVFLTANGNPINISKEALLKAKALLADELDNVDNDVLMKYYEKSSADKNFETIKNMAVPSFSATSDKSISGKSPAKAKTLFTEQSDVAVELASSNKIDTFNNKKYDISISNTANFRTARGTSVNSEQINFKPRTLFAEQLHDPLKSIYTKEIHNNDKEIKRGEANVSKIGFQTAGGKSINISEQALSKAKALFAEYLDDPLEEVAAEETKAHSEKEKGLQIKMSNVKFQSSDSAVDISETSKAKVSFGQFNDKLESATAIQANKINDNIENRQEAKVSSIGFQTAGGKSINISEQALSKAKALFAEYLDDPLEEVVAEETNVPNEKVKESQVKMSNVRFQSPGSSVDISQQKTSKAKVSFGQFNDKLESVTAIQANKINDNIENWQEAKVSSIGFQTAGGKSINISEQALSKAKALFAEYSLDDTLEEVAAEETKAHSEKEEKLQIKMSNVKFRSPDSAVDISETSKAKVSFGQFDDKESIIAIKANKVNDNVENRQEVSSIGFQTAGGKSINISEQALSKAKALFAEYLDDPLEEVVAEETNVRNEKVKESQVKMSNVRFQSPDSTVDNSKQTLKTKVSSGQFDDRLELVVAIKANKVDDNVENRREAKVSSIGFQTARGTSITVSERALSKAKALFADQLEMDNFENIGRDDEKIKKRCNLTIPHGGLRIASDQPTPVLNEASLKKLVSNDCPDESNPELGRASLQKRKLSQANVDDSTPLGRNCASETKKPRLSGEFQGRKLFPINPSVDSDNDENRNPDEKRQASSVLGSPKRDAVESSEPDVATSPVIGRQSSFRKKQKSHRRNEHSTNKRTLANENVTSQENVVQGSASRGKIEDDKFNTETRKPTQAAKKKTRSVSTESNETQFGDTQVMMDFVNQIESIKILQNRLAAALEQEALITAKRRRRSEKQSVGHLYHYKQINSNARLSLREICGGAPPVPRSYQELVDRWISPEILEITAATAAMYKFRCSDFYGNDVAYNNVSGIELEDGMRLIMDENGYAGVWELLRAFLAGPGVDPNLVPARWIENHYRWIVWKLASMDRMKFGSAELPRALTPSRVMAQLKYRYDREIDRSQRPVIRRILEKDDVASKRMILCVSSIVENNNVNMEREIGKSPRIGVPKWKIELTDGWYNVNACIDIGMVRNISISKVKEGTKLMMSGAELLNCDQGFYPLEAPADVCLKLHTNSTRRARWDAKLGYAPCSGPIPIRLRNVCPSGGLIGKMTTVVARVYPMLYHEKTASGDSIVRNAKSEEKAQSKYEQQCWSKIEDFQGQGLSGETDDMAIQLSEDYENLLEESISKKRHDELLQELRQKEELFKQKMQSKLRESLPRPRQVSQLLKVRLCDENANAILSIWSPSEEIVDTLKEGACVSLCNIVASGKRGTELQLTARRSAIFKPGKMRDTSYPARACTSLHEIRANSEFSPPYGEFDTVGLICSVGPAPYGMKDFDAVHLAYCEAGSSNFSYLSILFWQGIASYGYAEILTLGSIVACSNLEWRRATSWNVPAAYCTDRSTFTRNPCRNHLYESFENLRNLITDPIKYAESCTVELNVELQKKSTPTRYTPGKNTPIKMYNSTPGVDKKLIDYTSPLATPKLGTGNNSSYVASKPSIQKRIEKLQHYGEALERSSLILNRSKRTSLNFRSPILDVNSTKGSANQSRDLNLSKTTENL